MKKISKLIAMFCVLCMMASCSSNTPAGVVEKAMKCAMAEDYKGYAACMIFDEDADAEKNAKDQEEFAEMLEKMNNKGNKKDKATDFNIIEEQLSKSGTYAMVIVEEIKSEGNKSITPFYLFKDKDGNWKLLFGGSKRLLDK